MWRGTMQRVALIVFSCAASESFSLPADPTKALTDALTPIVSQMAAKYSCAFSVALNRAADSTASAVKLSLVGGIADRQSGAVATVDDPFVWGSVTKVVTGVGVLRLVDAGKIALSNPVPPLIDPL